MKITAKFPSFCARCGEPIAIGDEVEWERSAGVAHPACVADLPAPAADPKDVARLAELRAKREREARARSEGRLRKLAKRGGTA